MANKAPLMEIRKVGVAFAKDRVKPAPAAPCNFNNFRQDTPYIFRYSYQMEPYASPTASRRKYSLGRILPAQGEYQPLICLMLHMDERSGLVSPRPKRGTLSTMAWFYNFNVHHKLGQIVSNTWKFRKTLNDRKRP